MPNSVCDECAPAVNDAVDRERTAGRTVLLVEDNPADTYIVRQSLNEYLEDFDMWIVEDGEKAFRLIEEIDSNEAIPCPSVLLLDLNLPKRSGHEVLKRVRSSRCGSIPIVIVTSSDSPSDRLEASRLGATAYFRKPADLDEFMKVGEVVRRVLSDYADGIS